MPNPPDPAPMRTMRGQGKLPKAPKPGNTPLRKAAARVPSKIAKPVGRAIKRHLK